MENFCEKISCYLLKNKKASVAEIDEVRFGIELLITQAVLVVTLMLMGIYLKMVMETIVFIITLAALRTYVDGYHADSFYKCMLLTTIFYLCTVYLANLKNIYLLILAGIFAGIAFICQKNNNAQNIKISKLIFLFSIIVIIITYPVNQMLSNEIGFTLFFTSVSMEVKKYGGKSKNRIISEEGIK